MLDASGQVEKGRGHPTAVCIVVTAPLNLVLVAVTSGPGAVWLVAMLGASPPLQRDVVVLVDVEQEDGLWPT